MKHFSWEIERLRAVRGNTHYGGATVIKVVVDTMARYSSGAQRIRACLDRPGRTMPPLPELLHLHLNGAACEDLVTERI